MNSSFFIKDNFDNDSIHELLRQDIMELNDNPPNINFNTPSQTQYNQPVGILSKNYKPTEQNTIEQYIVLDSFIKLKESATERGEYKWSLNTQGQSTDESIGVLENIDYVTEIQMGYFYIPILEDIPYIDNTVTVYGQVDLIQNNTSDVNKPPTLVRKNMPVIGQYPIVLFTEPTETYKVPWINNPYTQLPFCNRLSVYIKESNLQSYLNMNNTRFNFEFNVTFDTKLHNNPNFLQVNPLSSRWDSYMFINPLRNLNTITLIFRNPDNIINFEPDIMYKSVINLTNDGTGGHITLFTQYEHKLLAGDRIFLKNFIPTLPDGSSNINFPQYLLNYIIRSDGHAINIVSPGILPSLDPSKPIGGVSFGLDPSIRILNPIDNNITISFPGIVDIFIAKRRLRIPIKIKSIKNKNNDNS